MNREEMIEQLNSLIEAWQLKEADLNQTDIDAIKYLLEENKKLHQRDTYTNIVHNQFQVEKKEKRYYENILDELEKWLEEEYKLNNTEWRDAKNREDEMFYFGKLKQISSMLEKLKKLKGE